MALSIWSCCMLSCGARTTTRRGQRGDPCRRSDLGGRVGDGLPLGMASKEVMVSAPLVLGLTTECSSGIVPARRGAGGRILRLPRGDVELARIFNLVITDGRGGSAGFGTVSVASYAVTQLFAWHIISASRFGHSRWCSTTERSSSRLCRRFFFRSARGTLLVGTVVALRRWPAIGFLGSSSLPCWPEFELRSHRDSDHRGTQDVSATRRADRAGSGRELPMVRTPEFRCFPCRGLALGSAAARRNQDYRSARTLWEDTVAKHPQPARSLQPRSSRWPSHMNTRVRSPSSSRRFGWSPTTSKR